MGTEHSKNVIQYIQCPTSFSLSLSLYTSCLSFQPNIFQGNLKKDTFLHKEIVYKFLRLNKQIKFTSNHFKNAEKTTKRNLILDVSRFNKILI